jgi:hypothetical protein
MVIIPSLVTYIALEMGTEDVGKVVCSLDQTSLSVGGTVLLKKGNPFLDKFNMIMRRYLEGGLLEYLWTKLYHRASLRGGGRFREASGDMFLGFSVSDLMAAFVELHVGSLLSSVVFVGELILNCLCKRRVKNCAL